MSWLRQSTAVILKMGPFDDSVDGVTPEEGLTIAQGDIQISKNGGAFAQTSAASPTTTYDVDGYYPIPLTESDTDTLGEIRVQVTMSGALPVWEVHQVVRANVWDSMFGADKLQVDATQIEGGDATDAINAACDTAISDVNLDHLVGTATGIPALPADTWLDMLLSSGTSTDYDRTTDSLQALRSASATLSNILIFQKNTAFSNFCFALYSATDHRTPATGKAAVITCERSIDGGAFAACTNTATEIGSTGVYKITLSADDMNGNVIMLRFSDSQTIDTFDPRLFEIFTPSTT